MDITKQIIIYHGQGFSPAEIGGLLGIEPQGVADALELIRIKSTSNKGIELTDMLALANQGLHDSQIAKVLDCSPANVSQRLAPHRLGIAELPYYKKHKLDLFNMKQAELLKALTPAKLKEMTGQQMVTSIAILEDKIRKEGGAATAGVLNLVDIIVANARKVQAVPEEPGAPKALIEVEALKT